MKRLIKLLAIPILALTLAACDSDDSVEESTFLRVLHASPDAPAVNITANGSNLLEDVDYSTGSGFLELTAGTFNIGVDAILPDDSTTTVIGPLTQQLNGDMEYSIIAIGKVADSSLDALVLSRLQGGFGSGLVRLQVVHASPDAPAVDIYVTAPSDVISDTTVPTVGAVEFTNASPLLEVAAGDYRVRVTLAGDTNVVFDTGTLSLAAGTDLLLAAINNTLTGTAPINLVSWSNEGTAVIADANAGSEVRAVHSAPDAPNVNVLANGSAIFSDVPYQGVSDYLAVEPGDYLLQVEPSAAPGTLIDLFDANVTLEALTAYTVLAIGTLDETDMADFRGWAVTDNRRRVATEAKLRLFHGSPTAGNVDIYVGTDNDISDEQPTFANVPLGAETGQVALTPGTYFATVTPTGTQTEAIGPLELMLEGNKIYTAVAADTASATGLELILLDDFVSE